MNMYYIAPVVAFCGISYAVFLWTAMNNAVEWIDVDTDCVPRSVGSSATRDAIEAQPSLPAVVAA